jgi:hypothetical protein
MNCSSYADSVERRKKLAMNYKYRFVVRPWVADADSSSSSSSSRNDKDDDDDGEK